MKKSLLDFFFTFTMSLNIILYFRSGNTQLLENVNYTENLRKQLNDRIEKRIIVDYEVY